MLELRDGSIEYLAEPLYHGDPIRPHQGVLVWRIFGIEMLTRLARIGLERLRWKSARPTTASLATMRWCSRAASRPPAIQRKSRGRATPATAA